MRHHICLVLAGATFMSFASAEPGPHYTPIFRSQSVQLPDGDQTLPGKTAEVVNANCLACHSAEMILDQPALSQADWTKEVSKMIKVYKAPVSPEDVPAILAYLVATKGKP